MIKAKLSYLNRLYSKVKMFKEVDYGENVDGTSPPSLFIGRFGYPRVSIGPVLPSFHGDTAIFDQPEKWLSENKDAADILGFRMQLIRGKQTVNIKEKSRFVDSIQEVALAKDTIDMEAIFKSKPKGSFVHEELQPFGPTAPLLKFKSNSSKFDKKLEKRYYDTDLLSKDAVIDLFHDGSPISQIQKAFSVGAFGLEKNRKLVPTRWSITAVDTVLGDHLLEKVREYPTIEEFRVYEYEGLENKFVILLIPQRWSYESMEAFFPSVIGDKLEIFGDWEGYKKKTEYAAIGGCFYASRNVCGQVLEKEKKQATVIILREAYSGYIPLGVWLIREQVKEAMNLPPMQFETLKDTLNYANSRLKISMGTWVKKSNLLRDIRTHGIQSSLRSSFFS